MEHLYFYRDEDLFCHHTVDACPDPKNFPIHAHEFMEALCFLSGRGEYLVEGSTYSLHPGDILVMRPAEAHKLMITPEEPYERIAVHFSRRIVSPFGEELLRPFLIARWESAISIPARSIRDCGAPLTRWT